MSTSPATAGLDDAARCWELAARYPGHMITFSLDPRTCMRRYVASARTPAAHPYRVETTDWDELVAALAAGGAS
jgi:hypothetical protein